MRVWWKVAIAVLLAVLGRQLGLAQAKVSDAQAKQAAVVKVLPEYPAMAKQMKLSGRVELEVYIDTEGNVEKVQVVNGNPILSSAAVAAVKKWRFNPFTDEGRPIRAVATIVFDFKL